MAADKSTRPLTALAVSRMKVGDELADTGENRGLRVTRTKGDHRYWYRFSDPATGRQKALHVGYGSRMSLAEARVAFAGLKAAPGRTCTRTAGAPAEAGLPAPAGCACRRGVHRRHAGQGLPGNRREEAKPQGRSGGDARAVPMRGRPCRRDAGIRIDRRPVPRPSAPRTGCGPRSPVRGHAA